MFKSIKYLLDFEFDDELSKFACQETILLDLISNEEKIILDIGDNLVVKSIALCDKKADFTIRDSLLYINNAQIEKDNVKINIEYEGKLSDEKKGIFNKESIIYTQCEPTYAKNIFPCFDNVKYRSIFSVTITANEKYVALSNSKIIAKEKLGADKMKTVFKETIPIPTYLFALCVGELIHCTSQTSNRSFPIEIYSIPSMKDYSESLINFLPKTVEWMEKFTNIDLPGDELQFLITNNHTGMENYGLVMYGPNPSLQDLKKAKQSTYQDSLEVFCHEVSHLWMGGVTTFDSWECLWIKEGFATFMSAYILNELEPTFNKLESYMRKEYCQMLFSATTADDSVIYNTNFSSAKDLYNHMSYSKASVVYRMLLNWIGFNKFKESISLFLQSNYLKTANYDSFVNAFSSTLGFDMKPFFETWTKQTNIPLIIYDNDVLTQQKFIQYDAAKEVLETTERNKWFIPLLIKSFSNLNKEKVNEKQMIIDSFSQTIENNENSILLINGNASTFCLVLYKGKHFEEICELATCGKLTNDESLALIVNSQILFQNKLLNAKDVSHLIGCFSNNESKLIIMRCIDLMYLILNDDNDLDCQSLLHFFENKINHIKEQTSVEKLLSLTKVLLSVTSLDSILNMLISNKFGKNVIKKIRATFSKK